MNYLKNTQRLSFNYGGKSFLELSPEITVEQTENTLTTVYRFDDGLKVTNVATKIAEFDAYEMVNWFENTNDTETKVISELFDCINEVPFPKDEPYKYKAFFNHPDEEMKIFAPLGTDMRGFEFQCDVDLIDRLGYPNHLYNGTRNKKHYEAICGRSCDGQAPFFNLHHKGKGFIYAIGWSGQWICDIERTDNAVVISSGIQNTSFKMLPGEKFRTSSCVIMTYNGTMAESFNKWRALVREKFSLIGKPGRDSVPPFASSLWGGMSSGACLDRIEKITSAKLPISHFWMDAGWYGSVNELSADEFEGDWSNSTGDWNVNLFRHPDGLLEVSKAIKNSGKKFVFWVEIERAIQGTPITIEHPEYFYAHVESQGDSRFLNLGNPEAFDYAFNTLCGLIDKLEISCYRQDFNIEALCNWNAEDAKYTDRNGISQIKHINALYKLWDSLLQKYPNLLIDNCCAGGRRIDIETLRRSIPLWRSDSQCPANCPPEITQQHMLSFSNWLPYSGTSCGRIYETYHARSCYAPAFIFNHAFSENDSFGSKEQLEWLKNMSEEYLSIRKYLSKDFFPLTEPSTKKDEWSAAQFCEKDEGIVLVFRRDRSCYTDACFKLGNVSAESTYIFTNADTGETFELSGKVLLDSGFKVHIEKPRDSRLFRYKAK